MHGEDIMKKMTSYIVTAIFISCFLTGTADAVNPQVAAGEYHTVGLKADGTVVAVGDNYYGQSVLIWTGIVQVAAGEYHTVGLKAAGSVVAVGYNIAGQCNVSGWNGIVQVAAGGAHTVGLKADGSVVAVGVNDFSQCNVSGWNGIVQVAAGGHHTVGLKADGSVMAVGANSNGSGQCNVSGWTGIVQVAAGGAHTVGLKADGSVVAMGSNSSGQCNASTWTGIVQVAAGGAHTVGLKADGSVVAVGSNSSGQCNASTWTGIVQVAAGGAHTVGLKADGSVVAVGYNNAGQCNVSTWNLYDSAIPAEAIDGTIQSHYHCIRSNQGDDFPCDMIDQIISELSIINTGCGCSAGSISVSGEDAHIGVFEFNISSLYGLFQQGKIKADLVLTIKSIPTTTQTIILSDMDDANEDGSITLNDTPTTKIQELSGLFNSGDTITFNVTSALEHDLFGSAQSKYSGYCTHTPFVTYTTNYYLCLGFTPPVHANLISFYDHTMPEFAPKLIVSDATLVQLSSFYASPKSSKIILFWSTESELDNAGFNLYRSVNENGVYTKINTSLISAKGSSTQGSSYEFADTNLQNRKTYYYKLEDIDLNGTSSMHGPVSATPRMIYGIGK
jgi:hypothetical protein